MINWEIFAILHLYQLQNWLIYWFFSLYHHTTTRWIHLSKRETCHAIKSSPFFKIASESNSSKAVSLKIEEVFEFNENRHFTETKNNGCQGSWLFISQVFLSLSLSLPWPPILYCRQSKQFQGTQWNTVKVHGLVFCIWYHSIYRSKFADSSKVGHFQDKKSRVYFFLFCHNLYSTCII